MAPDLAQVLNTIAHEIRTPLAVSQGYLKLYLDGRLTDVDETRQAFEQTRQALGALATLCVDMGKVSTLAETSSPGVPQRMPAADFVKSLRAAEEIADASWQKDAGAGVAAGDIVTSTPRDLVKAVAIVSKAAFDEASEEPHVMQTVFQDHRALMKDDRKDDGVEELVVLAGASHSLPALQAGPVAANARPVDFGRGGRGLKLIWAAFVLDKHRVHTWTHSDYRAAVGFRIPLVPA